MVNVLAPALASHCVVVNSYSLWRKWVDFSGTVGLWSHRGLFPLSHYFFSGKGSSNMDMCRFRFMVILSCLSSSDSHLSGSYTQVTAVWWQSPSITGVCVLGITEHTENCTLSAIGQHPATLPAVCQMLGCYGLSEAHGQFIEKRLPDSLSAVHNEKEETTKSIKSTNP